MQIVNPSWPSSFLDGSYTVATLPPAANYTKMYAWVTDLHDNQPDRVISDGTSWKPVRPLSARIVTNANSNMTLTPLVNAPTQVMQGTLTALRTVSLSSSYAYPGAKFRVKREAGGLFGMIVAGITMGASSWADYEYDGVQWVQTASGGLL